MAKQATETTKTALTELVTCTEIDLECVEDTADSDDALLRLIGWRGKGGRRCSCSKRVRPCRWRSVAGATGRSIRLGGPRWMAAGIASLPCLSPRAGGPVYERSDVQLSAGSGHRLTLPVTGNG